MHRARETTGESPDLSTEVQNLKEKLDEHSKQMEQSTEKLSQLQSENTALRVQNQALNATGNKKRRFNTGIQPMGNLNTPTSGEGTTDTPPTSRVAGATWEGTENPQIHDQEESDSDPEPGKEAPKRAAATEASELDQVQETFDPGQPLMTSECDHEKTKAQPLSSIVASAESRCSTELDSDQLPSGRMLYPNRQASGQELIGSLKDFRVQRSCVQLKTSGSRTHGFPKKRPPDPRLIKILQLTPGSPEEIQSYETHEV
ncbi:hypothetical protein Bca52824_066173 [Brassica carinata]|uniref:Uncharacterized protein n=1 Tax=Brassica carinata TaxID=52824 RepID=A0A8X7QL09_BRACI|nr:hypothetical protein Bca52824_066173 [Brassica carinata]